MPTATITPPVDLIELRADWLAADALCARISAEPNAGERLTLHLRQPAHQVHAPSPAERWLVLQSEDQRCRHDEARAERMRLTRAIADHPWWREIEPGTRAEAEIAVRKSAQALYDAEHAAAAG